MDQELFTSKMYDNISNNTSYKSYYFKKLSLPIAKLEELNKINDSLDHEMQIDFNGSMRSDETSFNLENTTVSSMSEEFCENINMDYDKQGSSNTDTEQEKKTNSVVKTTEIMSLLNKTSMMNIDSNFLESAENPSILYHIEDECNVSSHSYSSDDSEDIQKYSQLKKVFFTNSKYKCKHDTEGDFKKCKLPRQFQHHIITDIDKQNYENVLPFMQNSLRGSNQDVLIKSKVYKNFQCPKTACLDEEYNTKLSNKLDYIVMTDTKEFDKNEKRHLLNLITWRYSRRLTYLKKNIKFTKDTYEEVEYMCRMCKGKNWINNTLYFKHLFEEHGITTSFKSKTPYQHSIDIDSSLMIDCIQKRFLNRDILKYVHVRLLPLPLRMFVDFKKNHSEVRYFMQCGICFRYIKTSKEENASFGQFYKDHMVDSQCVYFSDPCYILGY